MRFPLPLLCLLACAGGPAWADSPALTLRVCNSAGAILASASASGSAALDYSSPYQQGDSIQVTAPPRDKHLVIQVDENVPESMIYSPGAQFTFAIPFGTLANGYDPKAFTGAAHLVKAHIATPAEIAAYRNVALDALDQRGQSQYFPHAIASSVTRNDPVFFERNAIDGNTNNLHHGKWPYESWGNGLNADPWLKVDFGRDVTIDKVRLTIRADFPHDTYWTSLTILLSDGGTQDITLRKTAAPQEYTFPAKTVRWIQLKNFKQPAQPLGYAAVTEIEVYGRDAGP